MKLDSLTGSARALCAVTLGLITTAAGAATSTGTLAVSATVVDTCVVVATPLAFSELSATAATKESLAGSISVTCTAAKSALDVKLGSGSNISEGQRRMSDGAGNFVPYDIYSNAGHSAEVNSGGSIYSGGVAATVPTTVNVYGQVPAGSYAAGLYTDTVTITVEY